jgi:glycosyltransferase involved in cell wall biosynthesis
MISVVTPVYNGENYIEACIKAVIKQNCPNVEHIIVDGASTDRTVEIIKTFSNKYSHINWISEPDSGQSEAMNKGVKMARAPIINILNVDDFYEPGVLVKITEYFKKLDEPSLLVGNCNILGDNDVLMNINKPSRLVLEDLLTFKHPFPLNPAAYFYHKSLHERIGYYNVTEHYMMDLEFIIKAITKAKIKYVDEVWGNHRHIDGTKTIHLKQANIHSKYLIDFIAAQSKKLPLMYKMRLARKKVILKVDYLFKNPGRLLPSIKNMFRRISKKSF